MSCRTFDSVCCSIVFFVGIGAIISSCVMFGFGKVHGDTKTLSQISVPLVSLSLRPIQCMGQINTCNNIGECPSECNTTNYDLILHYRVNDQNVTACGRPDDENVSCQCCTGLNSQYFNQTICQKFLLNEASTLHDNQNCHPIVLSQRETVNVMNTYVVGKYNNMWVNDEKNYISTHDDERSRNKVQLGLNLLYAGGPVMFAGILLILCSSFDPYF